MTMKLKNIVLLSSIVALASGCSILTKTAKNILIELLGSDTLTSLNESTSLSIDNTSGGNITTTLSTYNVTTTSNTHTNTQTNTSTTSSSTPSGPVKYTVMIYLCGSTLESEDGYLCTQSISNILSVSGQPDDVNIIIETGGASRWSSTYSIKSNKLQRYHVRNQQLVLDETLSATNNMGLSSTFESFIEWGLTSYPAEKTAVILSNHGGAMWGVCFDQNNPLSGLSYDWDDGLTNDEVNLALSNAFRDTGRTSKLEWIGYDACLMQVQDIAEFNSKYFNYMIASEESEVGEGWAYSNWIDDLYAKKDTPTILKEICDTYLASCTGTDGRYCTLSYLDLSKMSDYYASFESLAASLKSKITSSNKSSFLSLVTSAKYYGDDEANYYCIYDAMDFLNKLNNNSTFNPGSALVNDTITKLSSLIGYNKIGSRAGNSNGLCLFFSTDSDSEQDTYYNASMTNFTNW